ncbi:MAG: hypothetical protein RJQ09_13270 [Cyclobacteriaceae bacterium]
MIWVKNRFEVELIVFNPIIEQEIRRRENKVESDELYVSSYELNDHLYELITSLFDLFFKQVEI